MITLTDDSTWISRPGDPPVESYYPEEEVIYELRPGLTRCTYLLHSGNQCQLAIGHYGRHAWEPGNVARIAEIEATK